MKKRRRKGRCVICGDRDVILTLDHLPPRGFFSEPRPNNSNLITVKACDRCNAESSLDDECFKVFAEIAQTKVQDLGVLRPTIEKTFRGSGWTPEN